MSFVASLVLIVVLVIRPQEIWPELAALRLLDVCTGLVVLGVLVDIVRGKKRGQLYSPQLLYLGAFVVIAYGMTILSQGFSGGLSMATNNCLFPAIFMLAVLYSAQSARRLKVLIWLLLLLTTFVSAVAVHQGSVTPECIEKHPDDSGTLVVDLDTATGRQCGMPGDCRSDDSGNIEWACERVGLFRTYSTGLRVRWRGQLQDPNELSVFIGAVIPLLLSVAVPGKGTAGRSGAGHLFFTIVAILIAAVGLYAVILSQSRGGQLVVATVFGIYFVTRIGKKGIILGVLLALPVVLLGGRSDETADSSSQERFELLYDGMSMIASNPLKGVGVEQFADHSSVNMTAHNSYVLAAAELGLVGFFFWSALVWASFKIPLTVARSTAPAITDDIRAIAMAIAVSLAGFGVGIFFLSFTYKQLLFIWLGMAGTLYGIVRAKDPTFEVKVGLRDFVGIAVANTSLMALLYLYTRLNAGGG